MNIYITQESIQEGMIIVVDAVPYTAEEIRKRRDSKILEDKYRTSPGNGIFLFCTEEELEIGKYYRNSELHQKGVWKTTQKGFDQI